MTKEVLKYKKVLRGGGRKLRKTHHYYRDLAKTVYECSNCNSINLKRIRSGIWVCTKCDHKTTGLSYQPY